MEPSFFDGEYLLTDKLSYRIGQPKRGDVIVFAAPPNEKEDFIKRIIALPGERVAIRNNQVFVNDKELEEGYLGEGTFTFSGSLLAEDKQISLGENEYFVLGDNRNHSSDSRVWGSVPAKNIVGRAWLVYWPPQAVGLVPTVSFAR